MASWFGQYAFKSNTSVWFVLLLAVGMCLCFRYLTDFRFNLALIMSFFVWMGLILRLAIIQFKGNVDAFVQFGDLTGPEYNRAALYICLACGSSLLGIVLAGQTEREENETTPGRYSRIYFGVLLILGVAAIAQLFYLFYLTPILNMFSVYRPGDFLEKVLAYFRSEFFVLSLFAFAIWLIRPLDPQYLRRWKALPMIGRRLLLVIVIVYPLTRLLGGNRGFLFEEFLQLSFAALAVYNFGDLRLKINVARVFLVIIAVVISSMGWFVVEEIRKEAFSGNTLNSVNVTSIINGATENYDFSYFLAVASARVYLLDPTVLPINDEYFTSPDAYLTIDQSLKRAVNRITPASSIKPFEVNLEESELAYYRLYHVGTEQQRQSYTAPGLSYLTFGWWGGLAFMFGLSFVVTRIYKYFLNLKNRIHSVIACSILMYFYYEWWQTFGFDNLAYKLVWTSLTLWLILFLVGVLVGRRNRTADTADQKKPEVRPDGLMAVS
ncbi:MAG TPA: O-antigen polymerase [Pyrinomonadaceae bacterium]|jgi:oligosaccharide repeat unit polymerase|nr:O-antigen polymerase [Pyrinomonadaceae bacterium]